jgi:hypothetical protein
MILAEKYVARHGRSLEAYMALQRALLHRYVVRGGTEQAWCERMAPVFRSRYRDLITIKR